MTEWKTIYFTLHGEDLEEINKQGYHRIPCEMAPTKEGYYLEFKGDYYGEDWGTVVFLGVAEHLNDSPATPIIYGDRPMAVRKGDTIIFRNALKIEISDDGFSDSFLAKILDTTLLGIEKDAPFEEVLRRYRMVDLERYRQDRERLAYYQSDEYQEMAVQMAELEEEPTWEQEENEAFYRDLESVVMPTLNRHLGYTLNDDLVETIMAEVKDLVMRELVG